MRKIVLFIAIGLAIVLFSGCDNNNGPVDEKGNLVVVSEPTGASIFLDGQLQGDILTNATIELDPGAFAVAVGKSGFDSTPDSLVITIVAGKTDTAFFTLSEISDTGYIYVNADYEDAPVLVDCVPSGFTMDTIPVSVGSHSVQIGGGAFVQSEAENANVTSGAVTDVVISDIEFKHACLIEEFSHVNCVNCPDAAEAVQTVLANFGDSVLAIEWHPHLAGIDPIRALNPEMHDGRGDYYDIIGMPQVLVAAQSVTDPTSVSAISAYVTNSLAEGSAVGDFKLWGRVIGEETARIHYHSMGGTGVGIIKLAVVRIHRHFDVAPGSNGMLDFHNIARKLFIEPEIGVMNIDAGSTGFVDIIYDIPIDLIFGEYKLLAWFERDADGVFSPGEEILCSPCKVEF